MCLYITHEKIIFTNEAYTSYFKDIKDQDHYRVLGLTSVRIKATAEQVKKAHRFKVLKHHPDKRRAAGEEVRSGSGHVFSY